MIVTRTRTRTRARVDTTPASPMRSFDPHAVGTYECRAWETYYRRRWAAFLGASIGMVRAAFRMSWPRTLAGAWLVLRANMKWAPFPDNDPDAARALMRRFYAMLATSERASFDPARAAELEVEWWRAHRENQHDAGDGSARRRFVVRLPRRRGLVIRSVVVRINGRRAASLKGNRRTVAVDLRRRRAGRYRVTVAARGVRRGHRVALTVRRTYRIC